MPTVFDVVPGGLDKVVDFHSHLLSADYLPLMDQWTDIMVEGNRRGVLSGVDGNDVPMPKLQYRTGKGKKTANRRRPKFGTNRFDTLVTVIGDNLTTSQYQELTGPRLAPRLEASRIIRNLYKEVRYDGLRTWTAVCYWDNVLSASGEPFYRYHFDGQGRNPKYDLRPVRPNDYRLCVNAARAFVKDLILKAL